MAEWADLAILDADVRHVQALKDEFQGQSVADVLTNRYEAEAKKYIEAEVDRDFASEIEALSTETTEAFLDEVATIAELAPKLRRALMWRAVAEYYADTAWTAGGLAEQKGMLAEERYRQAYAALRARMAESEALRDGFDVSGISDETVDIGPVAWGF